MDTFASDDPPVSGVQSSLLNRQQGPQRGRGRLPGCGHGRRRSHARPHEPELSQPPVNPAGDESGRRLSIGGWCQRAWRVVGSGGGRLTGEERRCPTQDVRSPARASGCVFFASRGPREHVDHTRRQRDAELARASTAATPPDPSPAVGSDSPSCNNSSRHTTRRFGRVRRIACGDQSDRHVSVGLTGCCPAVGK